MTAAQDPPATPGYFLNVYKEISWTSHHLVDRVRRILGVRRVGHAGALDPLANGVVVVGVGRATKLLPFVTELPKVYRGVIRLGMKTASGDLGGALLEERDVPALTREVISLAAGSFVPGYDQIPPMVSALKRGGRRLYKYARKGQTVEREPRPVAIAEFHIAGYAPPRIDFELRCGQGTYVRALAEDLAEKLGTVATLECLTRAEVGLFSIDDAVRIISLPGSSHSGLRESAVTVEHALAHLPAARVDHVWAERIRNGVAPASEHVDFDVERPEAGSIVRILGPSDKLIALAEKREDDTLRLERVL